MGVSIGSTPCWACRKRRLVCDSTQPACKKCIARGLTCPGYEHKPLRWIEPGETRSKKHRPRNRGDPRDVICLSRPWTSCVAADQVVSLAEAVQYFNATICPDLLTSGIHGAKNPFYIPASALSYFRPAISEMVISIALGHRILQDVDRPGADRAVLSTRLQQHRGAAIRLLSSDLAQASLQTSDEMIACVMTFLLAEIQQSISSTWREHVDAASAIMISRGGIHSLIRARHPISYLLRYFVLVDIIGATTAPHLDIDRADRQLETLPLLPALFQDGLQTCVPCPRELLRCIMEINHLRSRLHGRTVRSRDDLFPAALAILEEICAMSTQRWVEDVVLPGSGDASIESADCTANSTPRRRNWPWIALGSALQAATALYCIMSLFDPAQTFDRDRPLGSIAIDTANGEELRAFYVEVLRTNLQAIAYQSSGQQLRKFTFWPLAILGIACLPMDDATQRFVVSELQWVSVKVGTASPLICVDFLKKTWDMSRASSGKPLQWESIFDQPYIFAL